MIINDIEFTFGADPELFIRSRKQSVHLTSAEGFVRGTKEEPFPVKKGAVQLDGMAAEFNIDPAKTEKEFVGNVKTVLLQLKKMLPKGYVLNASPVAKFSKETWNKASQEAKQLGCNVDYNAYTKEANPSPDENVDFRTGSGHIHIGWGNGFDKEDKELHAVAQYLCLFLDYYVGGPLNRVANDHQRMELYGKPGAYRTTSFGLEYRSPSNYWLTSEERISFVFKQTVKAVKMSFSKRGEQLAKELLQKNKERFSFIDGETKCP